MRKPDWSARGWARVFAATILGTLICIAIAFAVDSFSFATWTWRWGSDPINNLIIPLLVAPPFFFMLLAKMRQLSIAHQELAQVASTDSLTCLLNRRAFTEVVDGYIRRMEELSRQTSDALLVIDVDHFKTVNDRYGHDVGDEALVLVANTISSAICEADLAGRLGGEEFGVFLPGKAPESVSLIAERIRASVDNLTFAPGGEHHPLSISIGGVIFEECPSFRDLYRKADEQLYFAKRNGRNRVELNRFDTCERVPA